VPKVNAAAADPSVDAEAIRWCTVIGVQSFLALTPERRLLSYLDKFVLPVGRNLSPLTVICDLYFFAPSLSGTSSFIAPNGSSGYVAITDWLLDQWNDFPSQTLKRKVHQAGKRIRKSWIDRNQGPPFSGMTDAAGTVFIVPDPECGARLGSGKAV
jgi:hypothetical protein